MMRPPARRASDFMALVFTLLVLLPLVAFVGYVVVGLKPDLSYLSAGMYVCMHVCMYCLCDCVIMHMCICMYMASLIALLVCDVLAWTLMHSTIVSSIIYVNVMYVCMYVWYSSEQLGLRGQHRGDLGAICGVLAVSPWGVLLSDHLLPVHPLPRRNIRRWARNLAIHLISSSFYRIVSYVIDSDPRR